MIGVTRRVSGELKIGMTEETIIKADNGLFMVLPAGVSKGTVYYNFGSKSDLIAQLLVFQQFRRSDRHVRIFLEHGLVDRFHPGLVGSLVHYVFYNPLAVIGVEHIVAVAADQVACRSGGDG